MIDDEEPIFGSGHNVSPDAMMAAAIQDQRDALKRFEERRDYFISKARQKIVRDRQSAADAADIISLAGKVWRMIEAERLERSNPFRETANAILDVTTKFWREAEEAMKELATRVDAWTEEEDERIATQRREQEEALAALRKGVSAETSTEPAVVNQPGVRQRAPAPIPARRNRIRGDLGGTISATDRQHFELEDWRLLPDWLMGRPAVVNAIVTAARQSAKHMGDIPGIKVSTVTENLIR